jgi:hypothetical protein
VRVAFTFGDIYVNEQRKVRPVGIYIVEKQDETETEDIYDDEEREYMVDEDEITAAENALIQGREMKPEKRKGKKITNDDTMFRELAEDEYS